MEKLISYVFYHFVIKCSKDFKNHRLKSEKSYFLCILAFCDEI